MAETRLSNHFRKLLFFPKIFGIWPGRSLSLFYKCWSAICIIFVHSLYVILMAISIYFTTDLEDIIGELMVILTEVVIAAKMYMFLSKRKKILELFDILDSEILYDDADTRCIIDKKFKRFTYIWKTYLGLCQFAVFNVCIVPIFRHLIFGNSIHLPISNYNFMGETAKQTYFIYLYTYQCFCSIHTFYTVFSDALITGTIYMGTTQLNVINRKLSKLKLSEEEEKETRDMQNNILTCKLKNCLMHYDVILNYCSLAQEMISVPMFFQFGITSIVICSLMYVLITMPSSPEVIIFLVLYQVVMVGQISVYGLLGSMLHLEHGELVNAAYKCDWIGKPKSYINSLRLLMTRANKPLILHGMKYFSLTLTTSISIIRMAYSFFTLIRNVNRD